MTPVWWRGCAACWNGCAPAAPIDHEWFTKFRREDGNRWWITGGRRRGEGMPGFGKGSSAPGFPVLGGAAATPTWNRSASTRGWYPMWTAKVLEVGQPGRQPC